MLIPSGSTSSATCHAAVLGSPIAHSLSPVMHRAAYAHLGLDGWDYHRHECDEAGLAALLPTLDDSWRGLSLTMPLKEQALRLATEVDPVAELVGGANTLVRRSDGAWSAWNTDVHGIVAALADHGIGGVRRAAVLGSGATARSALVALHGLGVREVAFVTRSGVRPETAALSDRLGVDRAEHGLDEVGSWLDDSDLVVDTLPGAAADQVARVLVDRAALPALFEVVYEGWPTVLARTFAAAGAAVVPGLAMLAHQAVEQVALMTGARPPVDVLLDAARDALA